MVAIVALDKPTDKMISNPKKENVPQHTQTLSLTVSIYSIVLTCRQKRFKGNLFLKNYVQQV